MSAEVRLRVFCSLPDPTWTLKPNETEIVKSWLQQAKHAPEVSVPPIAGPHPIPAVALPTCGYRGFDIQIDGQLDRVYHNRLVSTGGRAVLGHAESIDHFLFMTNAADLHATLGLGPALLDQAAPTPIAGLSGSCSTRYHGGGNALYPSPPSPWDGIPYHQFDNCYGYANDALTQETVFPGNVSPNTNMFRADDLRTLLEEDGLQYKGLDPPSKSLKKKHKHYVVALLHTLGTAGDYHFMRLDHNGCWSQKIVDVTDHDDDHPPKQVFDLCQAKFNAPFVLAGFFISTEDVRQRLVDRGGGTT